MPTTTQQATYIYICNVTRVHKNEYANYMFKPSMGDSRTATKTAV